MLAHIDSRNSANRLSGADEGMVLNMLNQRCAIQWAKSYFQKILPGPGLLDTRETSRFLRAISWIAIKTKKLLQLFEGFSNTISILPYQKLGLPKLGSAATVPLRIVQHYRFLKI